MDVAQWFAHQFFNSHFWLGPEFDAKCVCYCVGEESAEEKNLLYTHIPKPFLGVRNYNLTMQKGGRGVGVDFQTTFLLQRAALRPNIIRAQTFG